MSDFTHKSNYNPETAFTEVIFGGQSPVLETELNEVQQIIQRREKVLSKAVGRCFIPANDSDISIGRFGVTLTRTSYTTTGNNIVSQYDLHLPDMYVVFDDFIVFVKEYDTSFSLATYGTQKYVVDISAGTFNVTGDMTTLFKDGSFEGDTVSNPIIDTRMGTETSRRTGLLYIVQLTSYADEYTYDQGVQDVDFPDGTSHSVSLKQLRLLEIDYGAVDENDIKTFNICPSLKIKDQLKDYRFTVDEDGILCLNYNEEE